MFNRKLIVSSFVAALMAAASPVLAAGSVSSTTIQSVNVSSAGLVIVLFTKFIPGRPACAGSTNEFVFDSTTNGGRSLLSTLTAAKLSGRSVHATGTNTCTGPRENMATVTLL